MEVSLILFLTICLEFWRLGFELAFGQIFYSTGSGFDIAVFYIT